MDPAEAQRRIARYLTGRSSSSREELVQALEALRGDADFAERASLLGLDPGHDACAAFRDRAPELADMSRSARLRSAPELMAHERGCADCQQLLWELSPHWERVRDADQAAHRTGRALVRRLRDGLRILADASGELTEVALGGPVRAPSAVGVTLASPEEAETAEPIGHWRLPDEDGEFVVVFSAVSDPPDGVALEFAVESVHEETAAGQVNLEIRESSAPDRVLLSGGLTDFATEPIRIPSGAWLAELTITGTDPPVVFEIPLDFESSAP